MHCTYNIEVSMYITAVMRAGGVFHYTADGWRVSKQSGNVTQTYQMESGLLVARRMSQYGDLLDQSYLSHDGMWKEL